MTDQPTEQTLTVRDLQAILADCEPGAAVTLFLPTFITEDDPAFAADPDALMFEHGYSPKVSASFQTSVETPYETFFDENGRTREGAKPNCVSITLHEGETDRLIAARKMVIEGIAAGGTAGVVAVTVPDTLAPWLASRGLTVSDVLASFARDLAEAPDSNGSDERRLANEWFDRVVWPDDESEADDVGDDGLDGLSPVGRARVAAMEWRKSDQASGAARVSGVVLVYDGCAYGWKNQLRDASHERPGAMAVDVTLGVWVAEGGNPQDGAERWAPVQE